MQSRQTKQVLLRVALCCLIAIGPSTGCRSTYRGSSLSLDTPSLGTSYLEPYDADIEETEPTHPDTLSPDQVIDYRNINYVPISLEECIRQALASSQVFRDIGGTVIASPRALDSTLDPAMIYSNPTFGEDAALSAFDAVYSQSVFFEKNDRPYNTSFTGDTRGLFQQDLLQSNVQLTKLAATGTRFTTRGIINYDDNNQAGNRFFHSWEPIVENEFRHPILQGSGSEFNRIAGPSQVPGSYNGILIARTNTEMSLADFEAAVRDFVVNVENSYWDLYYAYRELNAQTDARDAAYEVFKNAEADAKEQRVSTLEKASAYEQYLRFEAALVESMEGRPAEGTQAGSGSSGGVFRRNVGVRVAERRLRHLIGMTITDGSLLQPSDQPNSTPVVFDWNESMDIAVHQRPEIRRQRWVIKQRELQLIAAKNFLQPRLDLVGRHRFRGLGRDLTGGEPFSNVINSPNNNDNVSGGLVDLATGNFQEWQLGFEMRTPVGMRQAHAGVRNAELGLRRERVILKEQERKISLDLSNAVAEVRRSASSMSVAEQRYQAAIEYREQAAERIERGRAQFDVLLEAQRRVLEAQIQFINAEVENGIAVRNVHVERGTLLNFHGVQLAENQSDSAAYASANRKQARRIGPMNYVVRNQTIAKPAVTDGTGIGAATTGAISVPIVTPSRSSLPIPAHVQSAPNPSMNFEPAVNNALPPIISTPKQKQTGIVLPSTQDAAPPTNLPPIESRNSFPGDSLTRQKSQGALMPLSPTTKGQLGNNLSSSWNGIRLPADSVPEFSTTKDWSGAQLPTANTTRNATLTSSADRFRGITSPETQKQVPHASLKNLNGANLPKSEKMAPTSRRSLQGAAIK